MEVVSQTQEYGQPSKYSRTMVSGYKRTRRYGKLSAKSFDRRVRQVIMRTAESKKRQSAANEQTMTTIDADFTVIDFPWDIAGGDKEYNRDGNRVNARGISAKAIFHNNSTTLSCVLRVAILEVKAGVSATNADITGAIFDPLSSGSDVTYSGGLSSLLRSFNKEQVRVLRDDRITLGSSPSNSDNTVVYEKYIPLNTALIYSDSDQTQPYNKRYIMVMLPLQANADESTGVTVEYSYLLSAYYKDF